MLETKYYQLKIRLNEIEPKIWRRFQVPSNITLAILPDVIRVVMGWLDSHLHRFIVNKKYLPNIPIMKNMKNTLHGTSLCAILIECMTGRGSISAESTNS